MDTRDAWMEGAIQAIGAERLDACPAPWHNGGRGGIAWTRCDGGGALRAFPELRRRAAGEIVEFRFASLVTPALAPDPAHFGPRCYTREEPPASVVTVAGSTIQTLFHGRSSPACINYPFVTILAFDAAVADARVHGLRTPGYHTTGQASTEMAERRALPDAPHLPRRRRGKLLPGRPSTWVTASSRGGWRACTTGSGTRLSSLVVRPAHQGFYSGVPAVAGGPRARRLLPWRPRGVIAWQRGVSRPP